MLPCWPLCLRCVAFWVSEHQWLNAASCSATGLHSNPNLSFTAFRKVLNGAYTHPYRRGKKKRGGKKKEKKEVQQWQGSKGNKTHRNIKRTESLRGGTVFRRAELLETEKLSHAKVAGASKGVGGNSLCRPSWRTQQPYRCICGLEQRKAETRWHQRGKQTVKENCKARQAGNPHHLPVARGSAKHFKTLAPPSAEKLHVLVISILVCTFSIRFPAQFSAFTETRPFSLMFGFS